MFNPVRCVVFFCTDPVARFWLVCNLVFVAALTARSHVESVAPGPPTGHVAGETAVLGSTGRCKKPY